MLVVKRVYDPPAPQDGKRYLVDRIWPRGVSKDQAALDGWLKDLAPSTGLREWFNHEPEKWEEFKRRYQEELASPEAASRMAGMKEQAARETVTLLFAAKDTQHNNAVALRTFLEDR